ncbi:hypothetical protein PGB90_009616 [Kerria lacca]
MMIDRNNVNEKNSKEWKVIESGIAGGLSGAITRLLLQPLDVIKTRFQLQVEPISRRNEGSKYRGMFQAIKIIWKEETVSAFWKGHNSAQILSILYGTVQFATFEQLKKLVKIFNLPIKQQIFESFFFGSSATVLATFASFPFDVIRTRFIAQGKFQEYRTIYEASCKIIDKEGFRGLYKGLTPTLIQSVPYGGCQFGFYTLFTKLNTKLPLSTETHSEELITGGNLIAGFLAGMCAKTVTYPFDLCRKRMQIQGFLDVRKNFGKLFICSGLVDCCIRIYKEESFIGFFKGLQPSLIKSALSTSIYFALHDKIFRIFREKDI